MRSESMGGDRPDRGVNVAPRKDTSHSQRPVTAGLVPRINFQSERQSSIPFFFKHEFADKQSPQFRTQTYVGR